MRGWSQDNVDCTLGQLDNDPLFNHGLGHIEQGEFDLWHANATRYIQTIALKDAKGNPQIPHAFWVGCQDDRHLSQDDLLSS